MSDPTLGLPLTVHPSDRAIRAPAFGGPRIMRMRVLAVTTTEIITSIQCPDRAGGGQIRSQSPVSSITTIQSDVAEVNARNDPYDPAAFKRWASADGGNVPLGATLQSRSCPADRLRTARHDLAQGGTAPTPSAQADRRRHRPVFRSSRKPGPARYSICLPVRARGKAVAGMERDRREPTTGYSRAFFIPVTFRVRNATVE
jgi:hypothetical protein